MDVLCQKTNANSQKIKILWLCNKALSENDSGTSGTWLDAMSQMLVDSEQVVLGNISMGDVKKTTRQDYGPVSQWLVPYTTKFKHMLNRHGLPDADIVESILNAVAEFAPDLVHIWGTENYWGILSANKMIRRVSLLEMQGLKLAIAKVYGGGLSFSEQMACVGLKEVIRQSSIFNVQKQFERWGEKEKAIIAGHKFITTQSYWMESQIKAINRNAKIFHTELILRNAFYKSEPWQYSRGPVIFCSAAYTSPFKGLHVAIRAIEILKRRFPHIELHIAGAHQRTGIRRDGYITWVCKEIKRAGLEPNVAWLGTLSADQLVTHLTKCSAIVLPSYVESYCVALAEAMMLGVPAVVSYTGGTSWLAADEVSALFFPPGDAEMCAFQLERTLEDKALATRLSAAARETAKRRHDPNTVIMNQLGIYRQAIAEGTGAGAH